MSYKFVDNFNQQIPTEPIYKSFFQIATFPNSKTKSYHIRKFVINDNNQKRRGTPGIEPGTSRSGVECSPTELCPRYQF